MKNFRRPLSLLTVLAFGTQSYADVLQTSVGANHTIPKVLTQNENTITSQSVEINPYGKLSDVNQDQAEVVGIDFDQNPFIYASGYHDTESSIEYMGARYYSADIGRFMAQDSYDLINRYNYANANPIMFVDPDGHFPQALNYILNGIGFVGGILGAVYSGGSSLAFWMGISGATSGVAGIGAQAARDKGADPTVWSQVSFYSGIVSIGFDVVSGVSALAGKKSAQAEIIAGKKSAQAEIIAGKKSAQAEIIAGKESAQAEIIAELEETKKLAAQDMQFLSSQVSDLQVLEYYQKDPDEYIREDSIMKSLNDLSFKDSHKSTIDIGYLEMLENHPVWNSIKASKNFHFNIVRKTVKLRKNTTIDLPEYIISFKGKVVGGFKIV